MNYVCYFTFKCKKYVTESTNGLRTFSDGFWVNQSMQFTHGEDARYWIMPCSILYIEKKGDISQLYCDGCVFVKPSEEDQTAAKEGHWCQYMNIVLHHSGEHPRIPRPTKCTYYEKEM